MFFNGNKHHIIAVHPGQMAEIITRTKGWHYEKFT